MVKRHKLDEHKNEPSAFSKTVHFRVLTARRQLTIIRFITFCMTVFRYLKQPISNHPFSIGVGNNRFSLSCVVFLGWNKWVSVSRKSNACSKNCIETTSGLKPCDERLCEQSHDCSSIQHNDGLFRSRKKKTIIQIRISTRPKFHPSPNCTFTTVSLQHCAN